MAEVKKDLNVVGGMVRSDIRIDGKVVLITGANTGLGYATAKDLATRGAKVLMACRDPGKCNRAIDEIRKEVSEANLRCIELDLASLDSVRACAKLVNETEERLDILINNAVLTLDGTSNPNDSITAPTESNVLHIVGIICPKCTTTDGFEMQLGVNHIGHFLLTNLLLELIKKSAPSRVVVITSTVHRRGKMNWDDLMGEKDYTPFNAYMQSKLANVLFARKLSTMLQGTGVTCNSVHPGVVTTEIGRHIFNKNGLWNAIKYYFFTGVLKAISVPPTVGAQPIIFCSVAPELESETGNYYEKCKKVELSAAAANDEDPEKLWEFSKEWTGLS